MARQAKWVFPILFVLFGSVVASATAEPPDPRGITVSAASSGVRRYTPGKWSSLSVRATNFTEVEGTATLAVYFEKETQYQFARRLWVPPQSQRATWLPIRAPAGIDPKRTSFDMTMMPLVESADREVVKRREGQEMLPTLPLLSDVEAIKTVAIYRKSLPDLQGRMIELDSDAYELMAEARQFAEYTRVIMEFPDDFVPPHPAMWDSVDQLILCGDRILGDSVGLSALRDWLYRGGRLCVFLDRTSPETIAAILGHGNRFQVVDRVELDDFTIENNLPLPGHRSTDRRRFDTPVELVRVIADGAEVHCQVNGWPAAFWQPAGDGEVLFMALAPNGWRPAPILPGWESLPENKDPEFREQFAVKSVGMRFYAPRSLEPNVSEVIKPILQEQIGYHIPSRGLATGLLGMNGLALAVGGLWLARRKQLDRLALLLPVLAGVTTVSFLVIGVLNNRSVPPSIAFAQLVRHVPDSSSAHVSGVAAMYQQTSHDLQIASGQNGLLLPLIRPGEGTTHRLLWTDSDSGHWLNVSLPAGSVQFAQFEQSIVLPEQVIARGQFGPQGFVGRLPETGKLKLTDALIASLPAPPSGVRVQPGGSFVVTPEDVFASGQYLAATVVSDESRRRQDVYRSLLTARSESQFAVQPTLFAWTEPHPGVISVPPDVVTHGAALAMVPLWIDQTPRATEFTVPSTFIRVTVAVGEKGKSLSYDARNGKWSTNASRTTNTRLRFQLPRAVLPCRTSSAHLTIKLNAPSRELLVSGVVENRDSLIRRIANPSGVYQITVDRPEWITVDERGGLTFSFVITESEQERLVREQLERSGSATPGPVIDTQASASPSSFTTWEIDYVRLDLRGTTL